MVSWFDLLFLEERYERWLIYFYGLVDPLKEREIEELCEGFDRFYDSRHKIRNANFVLWLAARNEGLTKAQRLAHAWARTREEVDDLFGGSNSDLMRLATEIMNMSGFDMHVRSAEGSEPSPLAATGGALSPPASPSDSATTPSTT